MSAKEDPEEEQTETASSVPRWNTPEERSAIIETSIQIAIRRGDFDDLPGAGKPLKGIDRPSDPNWWIAQKIESEGLTGIAPPAFQLRNENRVMEQTLDEFSQESDVREHLEEFNKRVRAARMQLQGGPPVTTPTRDIEADVAAWRDRRRPSPSPASVTETPKRRRWFRRGKA